MPDEHSIFLLYSIVNEGLSDFQYAVSKEKDPAIREAFYEIIERIEPLLPEMERRADLFNKIKREDDNLAERRQKDK